MAAISNSNISSSLNAMGNIISQESVDDSMSESMCLVVNFTIFQFHDESKDVVGAKVTNIFINVIHAVFIPVLFFVGFPSNIINMVVFFKHGLRQRINLCLFCLSLVDLLVITFAFLVYLEKFYEQDYTISYRNVGHITEMFVNNHVLGWFDSSILASEFVSAIISGERCICVVWPLRSASVLKTKTVGIVLLFGILFILGGRFVVLTKYYVRCMEDLVTGITSYHVTKREFQGIQKKLVDILDGLIYGMGLPFTLCTIIVITTSITAISLRKSVEFQKDSSSTTALSSRSIAVTKMLIYLSVQFLVLNTPNILVHVSLFFFPELGPSGNWANLYFIFIAIMDLCGALNSSLNFLVYYFFGSRYRESVLKMLCRDRKVKSDMQIVGIHCPAEILDGVSQKTISTSPST